MIVGDPGNVGCFAIVLFQETGNIVRVFLGTDQSNIRVEIKPDAEIFQLLIPDIP